MVRRNQKQKQNKVVRKSGVNVTQSQRVIVNVHVPKIVRKRSSKPTPTPVSYSSPNNISYYPRITMFSPYDNQYIDQLQNALRSKNLVPQTAMNSSSPVPQKTSMSVQTDSNPLMSSMVQTDPVVVPKKSNVMVQTRLRIPDPIPEKASMMVQTDSNPLMSSMMQTDNIVVPEMSNVMTQANFRLRRPEKASMSVQTEPPERQVFADAMVQFDSLVPRNIIREDRSTQYELQPVRSSSRVRKVAPQIPAQKLTADEIYAANMDHNEEVVNPFTPQTKADENTIEAMLKPVDSTLDAFLAENEEEEEEVRSDFIRPKSIQPDSEIINKEAYYSENEGNKKGKKEQKGPARKPRQQQTNETSFEKEKRKRELKKIANSKYYEKHKGVLKINRKLDTSLVIRSPLKKVDDAEF